MLIDLNSIAKACWENKYDTNKPPQFDDVDFLTESNVEELLRYIGNLEENNSYFEFRDSLIAALKTLLVIANVKQINLNDFFKISVNIND